MTDHTGRAGLGEKGCMPLPARVRLQTDLAQSRNDASVTAAS